MFRLALGFLAASLLGGLLTALGLRFVTAPALISADAPGAGVVSLAPAPLPAPPASLGHLPQWVQTRQVAPLWSGPDKQAVQFTTLPAWTFLRVAGAQNNRLKVEYEGDGKTRQPGPGWVSVTDVQPSDQSGSWLRNYRASSLFADSASPSVVVALSQWTWMVRSSDDAAAAVNGRLKVRAYSAALASVVGEGWVPAEDVGPTDAPAQSVWSGASASPPPAPSFDSHDTFIVAVATAAKSSAGSVPVSVTVAQAILESNWGQSGLSRQANNYFGIKASGQIGSDGAVWMRTVEYVQGRSASVLAPFRAYKSLADSVADHAQLFRDVPLYRPALQAVSDPDEFARRIAQAGYATDPNYAQKLIDLMQRYDLYRFDQAAA